MPYEIDIVSTDAVITAVARDTVRLDQISRRIRPLFDQVYDFLKRAPVRQSGDNIALYRDDAIHLEAGVPVTATFAETPTVHCSSLPAGQAAHIVHFGAYSQLRGAHRAVVEWCAEKGIVLAGPRWEVYGDWNEDPSLMRTDVYYLLSGVPDPSGGAAFL